MINNWQVRIVAFGQSLLAPWLWPDTLKAQDWTLTSAPTEEWVSVACSANGSKLVAVANTYPNGGPIIISTNSGATWSRGTLSGGPSIWRTNWASVACSADGTKMVAAGSDVLKGLLYPAPGLIYTSTNSGASWTATTAPSALWSTVATSADGVILFAGVGGYPGGQIYISTNSGAAWTPTTSPSDGIDSWRALACSADGSVLLAASSLHNGYIRYGMLYVSTNSGATWGPANLPESPLPYKYWSAVACSADGIRLVAVSRGIPGGLPVTYFISLPIYLSPDSGASWSSATPLDNWSSVACSADGNSLIALASFVSTNGGIYTSSNAGVSWAFSIIACTNQTGWSAVASSADGARVVAATYGGQIFTRSNPVVSARLSIALPEDQVILSWLIPSTTFVLQQTPSLAQPNWADVDVQPTLNYTNLNQELTLPAPSGPMFYRLVSR